jgi:hypothetical protein
MEPLFTAFPGIGLRGMPVYYSPLNKPIPVLFRVRIDFLNPPSVEKADF